MNASPTSLKRTAVVAAVFAAFAVSTPAADDHVNSNKDQIDALTDKTALLQAQVDLLKVQNSLATEQFPQFPDGFGKKGAITVTGTDKVAITSQTVTAFKEVAKKLQEIFKEAKPVVLLTAEDRAAVPRYWVVKLSADQLQREIASLAGAKEVKQEALGASLLSLGLLGSQVAQFTQLWRVDRSLDFSSTTLSEDLMNSLVVSALPGIVTYPGADTDTILTRLDDSSLSKQIQAIIDSRADVAKRAKKAPNPDKKEKTKAAAPDKDKKPAAQDEGTDTATALLAKIDGFIDGIKGADETTKLVNLVMLLRGERAAGYLQQTNGRVLSLSILEQGGASMKTSSIWRSDRFYTSGGVVVAYKVTTPEAKGRVETIGTVESQTKFAQVKLE